MRKVFWCGAFLAVAAATAVYVAADYGKRCPDDPLVQCAAKVCQWPVASEVVLRVGQALVSWTPNRAPQPAAVPADDIVLDLPDEPQPVPVEPPRPPVEVIDLTTLPVFNAQNEPREDPAPVTVGPFAVGADDEAYKVMPPCLDLPGELTALMPYACDPDSQRHRPTACPCPETDSDGRPVSKAVSSPGDPEEQEPKPDVSPAGKFAAPKPVAGHDPRGVPASPRQLPSMLPSVDTTEFRPSDARKGEFERTPF
jgi:hypothetical protein